MATTQCEHCGASGSVTVTTLPSNREHATPSIAHHYCRACAGQLGVPLRDRDGVRPDVAEPAHFGWAEVEIHLAQYERALRQNPTIGAHIFEMAAKMLEFCDHLPGSPPASVRAAFARLGVATDAEAE